ncbi:hydrogenase accessory protein HypB [Helicobacter muridarum]|uniref:Hydrogenase accessory protein HypB n=1 Tax=Helicobacter muridarum TaxID=216 RepID=A0A377PXU2_9HELI|nr:hydrogenase nickel incorporation protein HypB [Helicobacter muridarum]TLE00440.1 hydrogenase accessory protein HypB [Helicobacter muridarum]STQ86413.1 hydrogenase expression/formation protein [Helicobacter muridarum]
MIKDISISKRVLSANDKVANMLRDLYKEHGKYVINLMSSPGSGKTTLLESLSQTDMKFCVIEGDLETNRDADRLLDKGVLAKQITTGEACHLEAKMIQNIFPLLTSDSRFTQSDFIFIENVGNLVCPASYDLGAHVNVVLLSVPEGDDKVLKYPSMFLCADVVLITKADMTSFFNFDVDRIRNDLRSLRGNIELMMVSSKDVSSIESLKQRFQQFANDNYVSSHIYR